ncbi:carbohydrate ABC transporter permease [Microbacterium resistens]|uniref:Carbohydrate ABC transporter permease n=1 Tax=Microbacterium resistens TaxID=156977 RepID=A0ABY3RT88_9MICO|nr:carbohydrate ABC transporter permease [Microbacterium resistens]UGS26180.1 carbohydrate ABC transporter permease [Microbacterium resistens]
MTLTAAPPPAADLRRRTAAPAPRRRGPAHPLGSRVVVNGLLLIGSLYMVLPILWLVFAATKSASELYGTPGFHFGSALVQNVADVLTEADGVFVRWMLNSLLYAGVGALLGGLISVMAGYAFDKFRFRGRGALLGAVLVGVLIPNTATVLPLYLLASSVGLTNTVWAVLVPVLCNPFGVYLARVFSAAYVPDEVLEAARVDGASPVRSFVSIGLPMLTPGFVTIALFQFVGIWNNFMLPLVMLQNRELFPVSVGMSIWQGYTLPQPEFTPMVITGSFLSVIPLIVAFILLQRFWRAGLAAGSVK